MRPIASRFYPLSDGTPSCFPDHRLGTSVEDRPCRTPTTTVESFLFPDGLSPDILAADFADDPRWKAISDAARRLVELRDHWLNPPEGVEWVDEPVPGCPKRPVPRAKLRLRTSKIARLQISTTFVHSGLTDANAGLNAMVAAAYGWEPEIPSDEAFGNLLALNSSRSKS